ncbi:MAG: iron ABC transporter permease [Bacteroidota bacterium]
MSPRFRSWILPALLGLFFVGYVLYPVASLAVEGFPGQGPLLNRVFSFGALHGWTTMEAISNSLFVSVLSVLFGGGVGLLLAITLTQFRFPGRRLLALLAVIPVALPPLVGVVAFMFAFGETGILPRLMEKATGIAASSLSLDGIPAILSVHAYSFNAFFFLFASTALGQVDGSLLEAAENLGAGPGRVFRSVLLPELRPALFGASILTFLASMASFSAPLLFAGSHRFITLEIFTTKLNGNIALAARQSLLLLSVSLICFVVMHAVAGSAFTLRRSKGSSKPAFFRVPRILKTILIVCTVVIVSLEVLPLAVILMVSFAQEGSWTYQLFPSAYSLGNYTQLLMNPSVFQPIANSLSMGSLALAGSLAVGASAAYLTTKGVLRKRQRLLDVLFSIPYAIPGTVLAIGLILAFNRPTFFSGMEVLVGTFWILPLAYVLRTYPLIMRSVSSALQQVDDGLLEAAASLGASSWRRFRSVVIPLILPGIIAGSVLTIITLLGEFVASVLLYTYSNRPIAVEILAQVRSYNFGQASAYCVVVLVLILFIVRLSDYKGRKARV